MNKNLLFLMFLTVFLRLEIRAQEGQPCPSPPPDGAGSCQSSCVYCDFNGYMGTNDGTPSGGDSGCPGIQLHNDQWFGFIAGSTSITIDVLTSNCQTGDGLQAAFMDNCGDANALACNGGCAGCGGSPVTLSYSDFTEGQTYWLYIDGYINDTCDYEIAVTDGSITPPPPDPPGMPVGPMMVCPGAEVVYTIPDSYGAGYYHWTSPAGSSINGLSNNVNINAPDGTQVTVTFGTAGGNVCVQAGNSCNPVTPFSCIAVVNQPIPVTVKPPIVICNDDLPFTWDEEPYPTLTAPGSFTLNSTPYSSFLGCDSVVRQIVVVKPQLTTNLPTQYICNGSCFPYAGNDYCDGGPQSVVLTSFQGCDSLVNFAISVLSPLAQISGGNNSITCATPGGLQLSAVNYSGGSSFQWTNANWNILGGAPTQNITMTGTYHLVVSTIGGGVVCRDTAEVMITGNTTPPGVTATNTNINCISTIATLSASSLTPGVNYVWAGPGITPANQFLQNPTVTAQGLYTVTVTNPVNSCTSTANVTVIADNTPPAATAVGGDITCLQNNVVLDGGTGPNVLNPLWLWTGPGINPGNQNLENPTVTVNGTYLLTVTNQTNGCTNTATAVVNLNNTIPTAGAGQDATLTCLVPNVNLQGSGNTGAAPMGISWTGPNSFTSTLLNPSVNQAGLYILTITNQSNGCLKMDSVNIAINQTAPMALAGADSIINCAQPAVFLVGSSSTNGPNITVLWTGPGINIGNQNLYNPEVTVQGTYTLLITNTTNGCTDTDTVLVNLNNTPPVSDAGGDQLLTCTSQNGVTLNGGGTPAGIVYLWTGPGIGGNNAALPNPTVTLQGTYTLQVTDPVNGCTSTDVAIVTQDANVPTANGGVDHVLNCTVNAVDFDGSGSSAGMGITYTWSGPGISGANITAQSPLGITQPGTYNLIVENANNNCSNTDVVVVILDNQPPTASAGADLVLNCFNNAIDTLDGTGSDAGSIYTYLWSGPGIVPGDETLQNPIVNNQPGTYSLTVTNTNNTCTAVDQVLVATDLGQPTADAGTDQTIDCVVLFTPIGGASSSGADFTYLWTGPDITPANETLATPTVDLPGTYTIVVTDITNGCTLTDDVVVNTNAVYPTVLAGADGLLTCAVLNTVLDGSASTFGAGFNLLWSGPGITPAIESQPSPSVSMPGTYVLSITNTTNSCVETDTVVVAQNNQVPNASAGADGHLDCQTTTVVLDGSLSDVSPTITYLWTGPGITPANEAQQSPSVTQMGTYTVLVTDTDNGCSLTDNVVITQDIAPPTADAGATVVITCTNATQTIDGAGSSTGALFTYVWQGPGINSGNFGQQSPVVADSGTYVVTVTNMQNHCTDTDFVFVDMDQESPITAAGPDRTLTCAVTSVQLDGTASQAGPNISFLWSGPSILPGEETIATPTVDAAGAYSLTVTNALNGCSATDFTSVDEDIAEPDATAGSDLVITCATSSTGVVISSAGSSSGPGFTYLWTGPGISPANETLADPTVITAGTYTLVVTNMTTGCTKSDVMDVTLTTDLPTPSAGPDQTITCGTLTVTLDASGSTSGGGTLGYTWAGPGINSGNINSETPSVSIAGTYTVTVLNSITGCQAPDEVVVLLDNIPPTVTLTTDIITCLDPNGNLSVTSSVPNSTYLWDGLGVNNGNETLAAFTVTEAGDYHVTVTGPNGCTAVGTTTMAIDDNVPAGDAEGAVLNCYNGGTATVAGQVNNPPGTTFNWTGPGIGTVNALTATVTQPGFYTFTLISPAGCTISYTKEVVSDFDVPAIDALPTDQLDCSTTEVGIVGTVNPVGPTLVYQWTTADGNILSGANTLTPVVDMAGSYQFKVLNTLNGCADSILVPVVNDPRVPTAFDLGVRDIVCYGDTDGSIQVNSVVGGTEPFNFTLTTSDGTITNQYNGLSAGDYLLEMIDANGCELDSTISIGSPDQALRADLGLDIEVQLGETATVLADIQSSEPIQSVTWNYAPNCDTIGFCNEFTYLPLNSYRHTVTVVDSNGCIARDDVNVIVNKPRNIYVPNIFNPDSSDPDNFAVRIYMGPDVLFVHKWLIFDRWGELVHQVDNIQPGDFAHGWKGKVRGENGQLGVYVWYALVEFIDGEIIEYKGDVTLYR